jgi:hypothetical protein
MKTGKPQTKSVNFPTQHAGSGDTFDQEISNRFLDLTGLTTTEDGRECLAKMLALPAQKESIGTKMMRLIFRVRTVWPGKMASVVEAIAWKEAKEECVGELDRLLSVFRQQSCAVVAHSQKIELFMDIFGGNHARIPPLLQEGEIRAKLMGLALIWSKCWIETPFSEARLIKKAASFAAKMLCCGPTGSGVVSFFLKKAMKQLIVASPGPGNSDQNEENGCPAEELGADLWPILETTLFGAKNGIEKPALLLSVDHLNDSGQLFLEVFIKTVLHTYSGSHLELSSTFQELIQTIKSIIAGKLTQSVTQSHLKSLLRLFLTLVNRSPQLGFLHLRPLNETLRSHSLRSPDHFRLLYAFRVRMLRQIFAHFQDSAWLHQEWFKDSYLSNFKLLYSAAARPAVEYLENNSAKMGNTKSQKLNTAAKLVTEFELLTMDMTTKEEILGQLLRLLEDVLESGEVRATSPWSDACREVTKHVMSHGLFFPNLPASVQSRVGKFLAAFSWWLKESDSANFWALKYSIYEFAVRRLGAQKSMVQEALVEEKSASLSLKVEQSSEKIEVSLPRRVLNKTTGFSLNQFNFPFDTHVITVEEEVYSQGLTSKLEERAENPETLNNTVVTNPASHTQDPTLQPLPEGLSQSMGANPASFKRVKHSEATNGPSFFKNLMDKSQKGNK